MNNPLKLFVQGYCLCGTSAYSEVKSSTVNQLTIDEAMRRQGWQKGRLKINNEEVWLCKKCSNPEPTRGVECQTAI